MSITQYAVPAHAGRMRMQRALLFVESCVICVFHPSDFLDELTPLSPEEGQEVLPTSNMEAPAPNQIKMQVFESQWRTVPTDADTETAAKCHLRPKTKV